jgi:NAD dependent epimerase/dehydratase
LHILVTGADGFIGSHLTEMLLQKHKVRALSYYNSFNYWGWLEDLKENANLQVVSGDIRDSNFCRSIVKGVDAIYHLAALIAIPYSYISPDSYVDTNIRGTLNLCQAAHDHGNIRIIHTSTSEVYGTAQYVPMDEKHPKQPQSPYSASKIGADMIAASFYHSFDLPVTIARPFNTYGPRQSARAIIPTIISQIAAGEKEIMVGDLSPKRDLNYVIDTCSGFMSLMDCAASIGKEVNICSNSEISMHNLFLMIKNIMNSEVKFITDPQRLRPQKSEVFRLWGDNTFIKSLVGYEPMTSLAEGLERTCSWFLKRDNLKNYKSSIYNV